MERATIQGWTTSHVMLVGDRQYEVKYQVYRDKGTVFQEVRGMDDAPIHTLELPDGMKLDRSSYEVLLRYVLSDVVAA